MKTVERELKRTLKREEYQWLLVLLKCFPYLCQTQINHYYDTDTQALRKDNITLRIREKNGKYQGTIKQHAEEKGMAIEENFSVEGIPPKMWYKEKFVKRQGALTTYRLEVCLFDDITVMLDHNMYLQNEDYELEIEYQKDSAQEAYGILRFLQAFVHSENHEVSPCKSERFFRKLEIL